MAALENEEISHLLHTHTQKQQTKLRSQHQCAICVGFWDILVLSVERSQVYYLQIVSEAAVCLQIEEKKTTKQTKKKTTTSYTLQSLKQFLIKQKVSSFFQRNPTSPL